MPISTAIVMSLISGLVLANHTKEPSGTKPALIPLPKQITYRAGDFAIGNRTSIYVSNSQAGARHAAEALLRAAKQRDLSLVIRSESPRARGGIHLNLLAQKERELGGEGYRLEVSPKAVVVSANEAAGLFYGVQTLIQMMPAPNESKGKCFIRSVSIVDVPRFAWRGLLLDVSRHFFSVEDVKAYIDQLAKYKLNVFHWHLNDDQGWRIEIKSRPNLTKKGAWRVPRVGPWWSYDPPQPGEATTDGGFYTQDQIREVVAYAKERFVTIVPEIECPGHSMATIASYPEISCTGGPFDVNPGSKFYTVIENSLCAGNDETFHFLEDVLTEVAGLFPGSYIHVGGDEAYHGFWAKCPKCQARMHQEGLKDLSHLQSYFMKRVERIVESKGKHLIGWDEILDGGLPPNAAVMSWRGISGGEAASKQSHKVVLSPSPYYYLDLYQGDPVLESDTYSLARLKDVYAFEPVSPAMNPKLVLGVQGNLWSESVPNIRQAEYMTWPRGLAIAETAWSPKSKKNWSSFAARVEPHLKRIAAEGVSVSHSMFDPMVHPKKDADGYLVIELASELEGVKLHYTFASANPDPTYPVYESPLHVPKNAAELRVIASRKGVVIGRQLNIPIHTLATRLGGEVKLYR